MIISSSSNAITKALGVPTYPTEIGASSLGYNAIAYNEYYSLKVVPPAKRVGLYPKYIASTLAPASDYWVKVVASFPAV